MARLRNQLIVLLLAATLLPLAATVWWAASLLELSLRYSAAADLDATSRTLERVGREFYQRSRESLKSDAVAGRLAPQRYRASERAGWPEAVLEFWDSAQPERFRTASPKGSRLEYMQRHAGEVLVWSSSLEPVAMEEIAEQIRQARRTAEAASARGLRRGFTLLFLLLVLTTWAAPLALLVYFATRVSRPIHALTEALTQVASGRQGVRIGIERRDEVGQAIRAFNHMAEELEQQRSRLVYLTQLASWQTLARKMAHELKNSLTPIRLTMEELLARQDQAGGEFTRQAAEIVAEEVAALERRVRAFSQFAAEPPVRPEALDLRAIVEERVRLLSNGHPEVSYELRLAGELPPAWADPDLVRGILTNLLENAAEAAGPGGRVLVTGKPADGKIILEVHDSGPGLSEHARQTLFEPTISFKKTGMGLGLSIARKSALLCGGDILLVEGELGGAGFRVVLPSHVSQPSPDR
ncbi:MAG: HAMP domain-containing histidine kinase [Bryobacteraceae bacterium]|nr:HAMP domain-containing histidine kinase [Bryobacteraceae bacterium]